MRTFVNLFVGVLIFSFGVLRAQDKKVIKYCAEEMYLDDRNNCDWERRGYGVDIEVTYNEFFKSYQIDFTDEKNTRKRMNFYFDSYGKGLGERIMKNEDGETVTLSKRKFSDYVILIELTYLHRSPSDNPNDCGFQRQFRIPNLIECNF